MADRNQLASQAAEIGSFPDIQDDGGWPASMPGIGVEDDAEFDAVIEESISQRQTGEDDPWPDAFPEMSSYQVAEQEQSAFPDFSQQQGQDGSVSFTMYSPSGQEGGGGDSGQMPGGGPALAERDQDQSLFDMLRTIADGVSQLTGAKQGGGGGDVGGKSYQFPWQEHGFKSLEEDEDYPAASPAFDVTNLSGTRGAGGFGFGSKYGYRSASDFLDPSRRQNL